VQEQNLRSIFRPGLSIENVEIIDADCVVGNFAKSNCDIIMSMTPIKITEAGFMEAPNPGII
jgi:hypothetical protein